MKFIISFSLANVLSVWRKEVVVVARKNAAKVCRAVLSDESLNGMEDVCKTGHLCQDELLCYEKLF